MNATLFKSTYPSTCLVFLREEKQYGFLTGV